MFDVALPCDPPDASARPLYAVRSAGDASLLAALPAMQTAWLRDCGFAAKAGELVLLPGAEGLAGAVLGLGDDRSPYGFGDLPFRLPAGTRWRLVPGDYDLEGAVLGFCLGAYRFRALRPPPREPARLALADPPARALRLAGAAWMARDLINTPANLLGPAELTEATIALARRHDAEWFRVADERLAQQYPAVAAVGAGAARPPLVAGFAWRGSAANETSPLVALCGKGVCFDSGGYDIKPAEGMLRMKKDMAGAAVMLALARALMEADLPIRLRLSVGCVENSISGNAMRPLDVIRTRRGISVEIGNTDAEGRLVLADLLAEACEHHPALLVDCATLTGAARAALGPDLPALFCNDRAWAAGLAAAAAATHDPLWELPLWQGYDTWLESGIAELSNVSTKPFAGAIVAALFLQRFVAPATPWVHLDCYGWNDAARPGRPEGGEAQGLRALYEIIRSKISAMSDDRNTPVT
jgi:leucyl aminopeptidase